MQVKRTVLKHHSDIALAEPKAVDHPLSDDDVTSSYVLQSGDHSKRRRFAAAKWADEHSELVVLDPRD